MDDESKKTDRTSRFKPEHNLDDRSKQIIERFKKELVSEGIEEIKITYASREGFGHLESFFDLMLDLKLAGKKEISAQEVFENMKAQINYCQKNLLDAEKSYQRLMIEFRDLQDLYKEKLENDIKRKNESK